MAIFKGNQLRGLVGNLVVRGSGRKGVDIVQTAPERVRQRKGSRRTASIFGVGSSLAALVRYDFGYLINGQYDSDMINRFNEPIKTVLRQCYDQKTKEFNFQSDSFRRIIGFEFNIKSLLIDSLLVDPQTSLNDGVLKISLPEIQVPSQLKFPYGANRCEVVVEVSQIALKHDMRRVWLRQSVQIDIKQGTVPITDFNFEVNPGCFCVAGIGLKFSYLNNQVSTPCNTDTFNPVNVCEALITPGEFIPPPASTLVGGKQRASLWKETGKLGMFKPKTIEQLTEDDEDEE